MLGILVEEMLSLLGEGKRKKKKSAMKRTKPGKKGFGKTSTAGKKKRSALVAKLKKQKGVRDPEALAAWIGRRMAGLR